jgi:hypothetical protein
MEEHGAQAGATIDLADIENYHSATLLHSRLGLGVSRVCKPSVSEESKARSGSKPPPPVVNSHHCNGTCRWVLPIQSF